MIQFIQSSQEVNDSWSFRELNRFQTSYLTHDYHKYPAKFIPQLASRLIKENSEVGDLICDPFMGSGTSLVEAIVSDRRSYGTDINPVAVLITKAKTTPIEPVFLEHQISSLLYKIKSDLENKDRRQQTFLLSDDFKVTILDNKRIDYWFPEDQKWDLAITLSRINSVEDKEIQIFLLCAFSNILKGCSRWLMKSVKPTIDKDKIINNVYKSFCLHTRRMVKKNEQLWKMFSRKGIECVVDNYDARDMRINDDSAALIVTSPPYVTSYEYADLHQLTAIWLGYFKRLPDFRSKFIGSAWWKGGDDHHHSTVDLFSEVGKMTIDRLRLIDRHYAKGVEQYFFEMQQCFVEMHRVLKYGGRTSIVIGDTDIKKVKVSNAAVFLQMMEKIGFEVYSIIKRPISNKVLPLTRDKTTGRFATAVQADRLSYQTEYILIMEKV